MAALSPTLSDSARKAWLDFRAGIEALRPELYRFCRHLTRSAWDADDLVQETLLKAYVALASQYGQNVQNPRAWLFRIAANAWIDRCRRTRDELTVPSLSPQSWAEPQATREAAGTLLGQLSPQERVAVVLKDVFDVTIDEIAAALVTTPGAVKAALHRGRSRLTSDAPERAHTPTPLVLEEFCAAFNARDLNRLTSLLLGSASVEIPGVAIDTDVAATKNPGSGILYHALLTPLTSGVPPRYLKGYLPQAARSELRQHRGEPLFLVHYAHDMGPALRAFGRFALEPSGMGITGLRLYYYSPEALEELARELTLPFRSNGYGY
jgi:RNA polymerase sigma-70 factor, ECF subfamily